MTDLQALSNDLDEMAKSKAKYQKATRALILKVLSTCTCEPAYYDGCATRKFIKEIEEMLNV